MLYFTDTELCMIEMLTYFNVAGNAIYNAIGVEEDYRKYFIKKTTDESITIGEVLSPFLKETKIIDEGKEITVSYIDLLAKIDEIIDTEFFISGKEWAQIIELILKNDRINQLVLTDVSPDGKALCFAESAGAADSAIVAEQNLSKIILDKLPHL